MDIVAKLEGGELEAFYRALGLNKPDEVYRVRVALDGDSIKVKANEWTWSPPITRGSED